MGENSEISWTDHTFNPWVGCTKVSPACDHCYAESWAKRTGQGHLWAGDRRRTTEANWREPLKWDRKAAASGVRHRVFCASLADVFDNQVPAEWRADLWAMIAKMPSLDWMLLTKRPQNIAKMLPPDWDDGYPNVWLGTTAENQEEADRRIPLLLAAPAVIRFLSCEPLLGPIDIAWSLSRNRIEIAAGFLRRGHFSPSLEKLWPINWVITGGESGSHARPTHPDWFRSLRDQCAAAGAAFHFKQHGEWIGVPDLRRLPGYSGPEFGAYDGAPYDTEAEAVRVGKKRAGRLLDGVLHDGYPTKASTEGRAG